MPGELLLDTGALVSLLDRSQTHHVKCRSAFAEWTGPVVSTEAVLTEATHLLAGVSGGRAACVDFFKEWRVPSGLRFFSIFYAVVVYNTLSVFSPIRRPLRAAFLE